MLDLIHEEQTTSDPVLKVENEGNDRFSILLVTLNLDNWCLKCKMKFLAHCLRFGDIPAISIFGGLQNGEILCGERIKAM